VREWWRYLWVDKYPRERGAGTSSNRVLPVIFEVSGMSSTVSSVCTRIVEGAMAACAVDRALNEVERS